MRFIRHNQSFLLVLAVVLFAAVMVVRQFLSNQSAHIDRREDFILLHDRDEKRACEWLYQRLIQELPGLSDRALIEDVVRTRLLVDPKTPDLDNLVWKYYVSVSKEFQKRAESRLERVIANAKAD